MHVDAALFARWRGLPQAAGYATSLAGMPARLDSTIYLRRLALAELGQREGVEEDEEDNEKDDDEGEDDEELGGCCRS